MKEIMMKMNAMYLMIKLFVDKFQKNPFKKKNHLTANIPEIKLKKKKS